MRASLALLNVILAVGLTGCGGGRPAQRTSDSTADTTATVSIPPPEPVTAVAQSPAIDEEYIVHGVCPFECCKYGDWTLLQGGALRTEPNGGADSVGSVVAGAAVRTDEGVMVLHQPGIAVVVPDTSARSSGPGLGDTVAVISYTGAKVARVRSQDQEFEMSWQALRMLREPLQRWWVHMTDPNTGQSGWLQMGGVRAQDVGAANSCKNK